MPVSNELSNYVRDAFREGRTPEDTRAALDTAGWTRTEIDTALAGWMLHGKAGAVPRPVRSSAARDAFFYVLLFVVFGMVAGNLLTLAFGQIEIWLPEQGESGRNRVRSLRWAMAAIIVFAPAFWALNRADTRAGREDPGRKHGAIRRWLSALAMLVAVITLLGDALYLIYTWLDGQMTMRFFLKSVAVAGAAILVLAYFREDRKLPLKIAQLPAAPALIGLAALSVALTLWTIGGPAQGRTEQRDQWRLFDLRTLSGDVANCRAISRTDLPATLDVMSCARDRGALTGFADQVTYHRIDDTTYDLCIDVEFPTAVRGWPARRLRLDGNTACIRRNTD